VNPRQFTTATVPPASPSSATCTRASMAPPTRWTPCWTGQTATASTKACQPRHRSGRVACVDTSRVSFTAGDPHQYVGRFRGPGYKLGKVVPDRVQVSHVFESSANTVTVVPGQAARSRVSSARW
jgi:hypothetical protein